MQSRILALDLGKKRIGLAISDPLGITAQGLPNLVRINKRTDFSALEQLVRERQVGLILMGNPINMRGDEGRQSAWVREFAQALEKRTGLLRCYTSRVENGHTTPSLETLERLATALNIKVYQLFFEGEGKPEPAPVGARETT